MADVHSKDIRTKNMRVIRSVKIFSEDLLAKPIWRAGFRVRQEATRDELHRKGGKRQGTTSAAVQRKVGHEALHTPLIPLTRLVSLGLRTNWWLQIGPHQS